MPKKQYIYFYFYHLLITKKSYFIIMFLSKMLIKIKYVNLIYNQACHMYLQ